MSPDDIDDMLQAIADCEGYETILDLVDGVAYSSVQPGICIECRAITTRCEPDAVTNWCHNCEGQTVSSTLTLFLETI